jgi:hypothetical protein
MTTKKHPARHTEPIPEELNAIAQEAWLTDDGYGMAIHEIGQAALEAPGAIELRPGERFNVLALGDGSVALRLGTRLLRRVSAQELQERKAAELQRRDRALRGSVH